MRWSLEELFYGIKTASNCDFKFWYRIIHLFPAIWRIIKVICKWIVSGYCWSTIWNLDNYLLRVIFMRLKLFKKMRKSGFPANLDSEEEWFKIIDRLIHGFEVMQTKSIFDAEFDSIHSASKTDENGHYTYTISDEDKERLDDAYEKQANYDEETFKLFVKYFRNLWD